jgi:hypothetical protein
VNVKRIGYELRHFPLLTGLAAILLGFMRYAGDSLPYQDPTPELLAAQAAQIAYDTKLIFSGLILSVLSLIFLILITRRHKKLTRNAN